MFQRHARIVGVPIPGPFHAGSYSLKHAHRTHRTPPNPRA